MDDDKVFEFCRDNTPPSRTPEFIARRLGVNESEIQDDRIRARAKTEPTLDGLLVGYVYEVYGVKEG